MSCRLFLFLITASAAQAESTPDALRAWLAVSHEKRPALSGEKWAADALSRADAETAAELLWKDYAARTAGERAAEMKAGEITLEGKVMKFKTLRFGPEKAPAGGRSLFLSLHGGGGAPAALNDQQWENQVRLGAAYKPAEGLYIAPRAPTNTWNLWHEAHIDQFFARIIGTLVAAGEVNPDRVYVMGYSAGGDGVYQLAPRMADWWAAAAMMAGHPNETQPFGLRNVPFALMVGEHDAAYRRNSIAAEWKDRLAALERADRGGYRHMAELAAGKPHWMDLEDRKAVPWMEKHTREPLPETVKWRQDDVTHRRFYWLAVPAESAQAGTEITAVRKGQEIAIHGAPGKVSVMFNDRMAALDEPVTIRCGDAVLHQGPVTRTAAAIDRSISDRGDPRLIFSAEVTVELPRP